MDRARKIEELYLSGLSMDAVAAQLGIGRSTVWRELHNFEIPIRRRGTVPGTKLKPRTEEYRRKLSRALKGRSHSVESRRKISRALKGRVPWNKGKHLSREICRKMSNARMGYKNPRWRDGSAQKEYPFEFGEEMKEQVRKRQNRQCLLCGGNRFERKLDVHHVNWKKNDCSLDNLVALCIACHQRIHGLLKLKQEWSYLLRPAFWQERVHRARFRGGVFYAPGGATW